MGCMHHHVTLRTVRKPFSLSVLCLFPRWTGENLPTQFVRCCVYDPHFLKEVAKRIDGHSSPTHRNKHIHNTHVYTTMVKNVSYSTISQVIGKFFVVVVTQSDRS